MKEKIQKILDNKIDNKSIFGTTLRIEDGNSNLIFSGSSGNLNTDSQYFIASTTKIYTSALIMKLRFENKLTLDDKLEKFLDLKSITGLNNFRDTDYTNDITVRDLLAHTSGIPDYFSGKDRNGISMEKKLTSGNDQPWNLEEVIDNAREQKASFKPGTKGKALYSDTNYQLLGRIIEIIRSKDIVTIFDEEIFQVLNLKNSYMYSNAINQTPMHLYYKNLPLEIPKAMASFKADGGVVSTTTESMIFLKSFFNGKFFPKEYLQEMTEHYNRIFFPLQYGVGIMKFEMPRIFTMFRKYPELIGHSGLSGAFSYCCPKLDLYFTGTVNQIASPSSSYRLLIQLLNLF